MSTAAEAKKVLAEEDSAEQKLADATAHIKALKTADKAKTDQLKLLRTQLAAMDPAALEELREENDKLSEKVIDLSRQVEEFRRARAKTLNNHGARDVSATLRHLKILMESHAAFIRKFGASGKTTRTLAVRIELHDFMKKTVEEYEEVFKTWIEAFEAARDVGEVGPPEEEEKAPEEVVAPAPVREPAPKKKRAAPKRARKPAAKKAKKAEAPEEPAAQESSAEANDS